MRKAVILRKNNIQKLFLLGGCFFLFSVTGCGLETYPYLDEPIWRKSEATYSSTDFALNYFAFSTNVSPNNKDYNVKGVEVYYKIFNSLSRMNSLQSTISSQNSTGNAANTLINSQNYKPLKISNGSYTPLIKAKNDDGTFQEKFVYIRLTDKNQDAFKAAICVTTDGNHLTMNDDDYALKYNGQKVYPRRNIDQSYTFNFGGDNPETDKVPQKDDEDVEWSDSHSEEDEEGRWYVDMYAVCVGVDTTTWTSFYSDVLHLGSVSIYEGEDN